MTTEKIYNFMGLRKIAAALSIALLLISIASLAINGLKFGLDFTGGSLIEVGYQQEPDLNGIRDKLQGAGYDDAVVQTFGSPVDILIRMGVAHDPKLGDHVLETLQSGETQELTLRRNEFVGAQVGEELREQGGLGMLLALFMVMVYVAFRFQLKFSIASVAALAHDVLIVLGFFSLFQFDFDLTVLAAILAVIGYSLNDTIVVSDRIRENFRKLRKGDALEIMNVSLSQTLGRTLVTSLTTLLVLVALAVFGGEMIFGFAVALLVGVCVGTYSSIYVAANVLILMGLSKEDLIPQEKPEGEEVDEMP
ncbi:protein translocase subunit SecF [Amphritea sp. 2_MG-2023]|uniref:protein translocase subunit SecF n=1 Tax=Amphritea TaxID=515417 RepID=UPI001C074F4C|nr:MULTISPECIES: protein translocase subunit SecF [Amphritea]MBU2966908.1 protein translocase subunit SecF [Amphritea atlantica]MDO6420498.1 protein translocase subunit SecF [Amphritea sp. 2_MG-2023]MDX2421079.1 protein translocase subunit SecF [Amphritea sp.]